MIRSLFKKLSNKGKYSILLLPNMKIAPKLLIGFLIIAVMSTSMGVYAISGISNINESSNELYANIMLPTRSSNDITRNFQKQCISLRQALLANDNDKTATFLSIMNNDEQKFFSSLAMVEALVIDGKVSELNRIKSTYENYQNILHESRMNIEKGNKEPVIIDLIGYGDLRRAESEVEDAIDGFISAITSEASKKSAQNDQVYDSVYVLTFTAICIVLVLSIIIGLIIAHSMSKPIKRLTQNAKLLAAGDTNFALSDKIYKNEIGQMEESFKTIVAAIQTLEQDTDMLIFAAKKGELSVRADERQHAGAYRKIVVGINATLDAMIAPINESAEVLGALSEGNLDASVEGEFLGDFAIIKNALNSTIQTLNIYIREIASVLGDISQGILTASINSEFKGDFAALKEAINKTIDAFHGVLRDINIAAEEVAQGAAQLSGGSQTISQGAAEQASAIEQLTATITDIAEQTKNNAQSANEANELSQKAREDALGGNEKMQMLQDAMKDINDSSSSISKIIKVIDDIAFQTNILALNAAVEAARAGAHGKGFAVVAEEVRNLAARSAKAAQETAGLIESSIGKTAAGTKIADEAAASLFGIVEGVEKTVTLSSHIATESNEQATGISQINKGIEQLSQVVQSSSATAQEAAASSEQLAAQADQLKQMVSRFRLKNEDENIIPQSIEPLDIFEVNADS